MKKQNNFNISKQLKSIREERGLSIRSLCGLSGLAVNTLSLIENGKTSPSVNTLLKLANALGVPITSFFDLEEIQDEINFSTTVDQNTVATELSKITEITSKFSKYNLFTAYIVNINPGTFSGNNPFSHDDFEFIFCLEGRIRLIVKNEAFILEKGDSLTFEGALPHRWLNETPEPVKLLAVFTPTLPNNISTFNHF